MESVKNTNPELGGSQQKHPAGIEGVTFSSGRVVQVLLATSSWRRPPHIPAGMSAVSQIGARLH